MAWMGDIELVRLEQSMQKRKKIYRHVIKGVSLYGGTIDHMCVLPYMGVVWVVLVTMVSLICRVISCTISYCMCGVIGTVTVGTVNAKETKKCTVMRSCGSRCTVERKIRCVYYRKGCNLCHVTTAYN